jgi:ketosteroid isomerase-like protein
MSDSAAEAQMNKQVARALFEAINAWDLERVSALLADEVTWELPYDPQTSPICGRLDRSRLLELYATVAVWIPGLKFELESVTAEADRVCVEAASHADTPYGPFHNRYHFLLRVCDSKIIEGREYADSAMMADFARRAMARTQR